MGVSLIAAIAENNVIGKDNDLIWRLPADLKFFKETTSGHAIIMGRKNYESIGRPLPNRQNIIITRNPEYQVEGCLVVNSLEAALEAAQANGDTEPFIIGGGEIYKMALPLVDKMYITRVHEEFDGDTFFPDVDYSKWDELKRERREPDEKNVHPFTILIYKKKG